MIGTLGTVSGQTWSGNTFFGDPTALAWRQDTNAITTFDGWLGGTGLTHPGTYAGSAPTGVKIVVRPNTYEPGRANIIVYNWAQRSTVGVDVLGILRPGDRYVVQNAQAFYGPPIESEGRHSRASLRFWARSDDELAKRLEPLPAQDHTCKSIRDHAHSDFGGRVACSRRGARSHPLPVSTARGVQRTDYRCQLHGRNSGMVCRPGESWCATCSARCSGTSWRKNRPPIGHP